MELYDVTVIGGGPVGLFGATMAGLHGMKVKVIESLPELGGQLYALYPEKPIYDVAGFPSIMAKDLAGALVAQMMRFKPMVCLSESVLSIEEHGSALTHEFVLNTTKGSHRSRSVLIAIGLGSFVPRRLPALGADRFEGDGVHYFVPALAHFAGHRVAVVGGGDTAVDWALAIAQYARHVHLIHRRDEFRAQEESLRQIDSADNITVHTFAEVAEILGSHTVEALRLSKLESDSEELLPVDAVVGGLGFQPNLGPAKTWGLDLKGSGLVVSLATMSTNRAGIYAVGDVAHYDGKVKLIATGFGEVGIALARIRTYLHPELKGLPHSTNVKSLRQG
ncbi:MAG: NAD(P)/FAD-dependent oxidoreductase [Sulfobacillus sp.]